MAETKLKRQAPPGMKLYKSYSFLDKDPAIDILRTAIQEVGESYAKIHEASDVSIGTLYNWFHGRTRRPHFATVAAVAHSLGKEVMIGGIPVGKALAVNGTKRPRLRVVKGGKRDNGKRRARA